MPVYKFRTIEEMNEHDRQRLRAPQPRLFERIESHWRQSAHFAAPLAVPSGVHTFRTIEEMNAFKETYVDDRIAKIRAARQSK